MKAWINMYVDICDLDVKYSASRESDTTEMWGRDETHYYWDIDVFEVSYNGVIVEDYDNEAIVEFIVEHILES